MLDDFPRVIDDALHGLEKKLSHLSVISRRIIVTAVCKISIKRGVMS